MVLNLNYQPVHLNAMLYNAAPL